MLSAESASARVAENHERVLGLRHEPIDGRLRLFSGGNQILLNIEYMRTLENCSTIQSASTN